MIEYFWYILASVLAGVGTGLVGLSAATVMVPILIVLCPSFAGETGAYQATAIALASDILGSALTTATYIHHKNIDLRRGWIMLVCIIGMCTVGSFAAWRAGNVVLGGFTLILTFCIGIRFLAKPSTERAEGTAKGAALDWKGIAVSLFFGLTIGFGTGFVGSGGGMMMLVVLTLLGAALLLLHYWEYIKAVPLLYGVLGCTLEFLEYIIPAAAILLCLHHFFKIPSHVFRKLLHLAAFTCLVEMMWAAEEWYQASLTALLFAAAVYPILRALEGSPGLASFSFRKSLGRSKRACFCCSSWTGCWWRCAGAGLACLGWRPLPSSCGGLGTARRRWRGTALGSTM